MGRLSNFKAYLEERRVVLARVEKSLCQLQEKYETFFQEISKVREHELEQLREHILKNRQGLPSDFVSDLDKARAEAERDFDESIKQLEKERAEMQAKADEVRKASRRAEIKMRSKNQVLDFEEEHLKERSENLLDLIAEFNRRIRELGRGFGFFSNLFRMRRLQKERRRLVEEQADAAARIEKLRVKWAEYDAGYVEKEQKLQDEWIRLSTEAGALQTKLEHLSATRARIVRRTAIEKVLYARAPDLSAPGPDDPPCPRCKTPNPEDHHFCHICARRLSEDRPDFEGSLREIAELNMHHERFSQGMRACQEIIGLVRGLISGIQAFMTSVDEMIASERRYPLPKLDISVPQKSVAYGGKFDELSKSMQTDRSLHPAKFAGRVETLISGVYTEDKIKDYFETMGAELSRQAERQW